MGVAPEGLAFLAVSLLALLTLLAFVSTAGAASGDLAWHRAYNGVGNGSDAFRAAAAAPNGGVYVAGNTTAANLDFVVARYDAAGGRRWLHTFNGLLNTADAAVDAAADRQGNLVVVGYVNDANVGVVKYGPGGQLRWARTYDDPESIGEAAAKVAVDAAGNIYVAGYRVTSGSASDFLLVKYSPSGARRWVRTYAGSGGYKDYPIDVAVDAAGNVYVTGYSWGFSTSIDIATLKYDPAGHRRWVRRWDGPAGNADFANAIAVTARGTVYVAGATDGISSGSDAVLLKYGSDGRLKWSRMRTSPGVFDDTYRDVALLGNGDVVVAGDLYGGTVNDSDMLAARFSPTGTTRWMRTYNGPGSSLDLGDHVIHSATGAIYVTGWGTGGGGTTDILTLKYNSGGALRWAESFAGAGAGSDIDSALVGVDQGVYVAGYEASATGGDGALLKYRP